MANYEVNYDDERFAKVESDKSAALDEVDKTYGEMIGDTDDFYKDQIQASKDWAKEQQKLQNEQTDFAIEQIEQQKQQAEKDYLKEQSGAWVDYQKQSQKHGVNAEQQAAMGMQNTGFSESSQVSMYNTYQNRVAVARDSIQRAFLNYNNAIKDARLQNNAALAKIAAEALQQQLQLALEGFQYKNTLVLSQADRKQQLESEYYSRWKDVQNQINTENALAEEVRQYNAKMEEERRQFDQQMAFQKEQFAWQKAQAAASSSSGGGWVSSGSSDSSSSRKKPSGKARLSTGAESISDLKNTKKETKSSGGVDMQSVLSLGYGPISAKKAYDLVEKGLAETYTKNGKTYFRKSANYTKQQMIYNRLKG